MPTISLDSESMNRGSFIKSVTFAEENYILEFDYKSDMIFPDYETPVKERSKLPKGWIGINLIISNCSNMLVIIFSFMLKMLFLDSF